MKKILVLGLLSAFCFGGDVSAMNSAAGQEEQPMDASKESVQLSPLALTSDEISVQKDLFAKAVNLAIDWGYFDNNEFGLPKVIHDLCKRINSCKNSSRLQDREFFEFCQHFVMSGRMNLEEAWGYLGITDVKDLFTLFLMCEGKPQQPLFGIHFGIYRKMICDHTATDELPSLIEKNLELVKSTKYIRFYLTPKPSHLDIFSQIADKVSYMNIQPPSEWTGSEVIDEKAVGLIKSMLSPAGAIGAIQFSLGGFRSPKDFADFVSALKEGSSGRSSPQPTDLKVRVLGALGGFDTYHEIKEITKKDQIANLRKLGLLKEFDDSRMEFNPTQLLSVVGENVEICFRYRDEETGEEIRETARFNLNDLTTHTNPGDTGDIRVLWKCPY